MARDFHRYTRKELIKSLATIKKVCQQNSYCNKCPFFIGDDNDDFLEEGVCGISRQPDEWEIDSNVYNSSQLL